MHGSKWAVMVTLIEMDISILVCKGSINEPLMLQALLISLALVSWLLFRFCHEPDMTPPSLWRPPAVVKH